MSLLNLLYLPLALAGAYAAVLSIYMAAVTVGSWIYRGPRGAGLRRTRFAVVIPAHDEGSNILRTLEDLRDCDYPRDLVAICVIADNCTDDTAAVARSAGALVFERSDLVARGKGQALDWFLKTQRDLLGSCDGVVFVDADMFVERQFFAALDDAFASPHLQAAQARYTVANPGDSWFAAITYMGFAFVNHMRPAGRCCLGGSAGLKGSGMAFRRALIVETGWPAASIAEDVEFGKELTLRGIAVDYVPAAIVTSNVGGRLKQVDTQQSRWERGKLQVTLAYLPRVFRRMFSRPSVLLADEMLDALVPPLSLLITFMLAALAACWIAGSWLLAVPFATALVTFAIAVVSGLVQLRTPKKVMLFLFTSPLFVIFKLVLFLKMLFSRAGSGWSRTPRDSERE